MAKLGLPSEHQEQAAVVEWLRAHGIDFFSVPNGASLAGDSRGRARQMAKLKAEGLTPGVPDLIITTPRWRSDGAHVVVTAIEMKRRRGGKVSKEQRAWIDKHEKLLGWCVVVCHGAEDAIDFLRRVFC
jgi:hypothetical protein